MSISLVAVFLPILLMGGMVGRLFREFAVVLSSAIFVSMLLSLTTTPMMCAALLRPPGQEHKGWFSRGSERVFNNLAALYADTLRVALRHKRITLCIAIGTLLLNGYLYVLIPKGFFPQQDTGRLSGNIQAAQDVSFQTMEKKLKRVMEIMKEDPDVEYVTGFIGGSGGGSSGSPNSARIFATLAPFEKARHQRRAGHGQAAQEACRRAGRAHVPAIGAGPARGRARFERAVPVHPAGRERERPELLVAPAFGQAALAAATGRREQRPAGPGPHVHPEHRPGHGLAPGRHPAAHRQHFVRRLRPAAGLHHLCATQPVSCGHGGRARPPAGTGWPEGHLRAPFRRLAGAPFRVHAAHHQLHLAGREPPKPVSPR
jgi:Cation/multidrug efflux pump